MCVFTFGKNTDAPFCIYLIGFVKFLFANNRSYVFFMRQLRLAHFLFKGDFPMPDYQKLYIDLFNQVSKTIDILKNAQDETLDAFMNFNPPKEDVIEVVDKIKFPHSSAYELK